MYVCIYIYIHRYILMLCAASVQAASRREAEADNLLAGSELKSRIGTREFCEPGF